MMKLVLFVALALFVAIASAGIIGGPLAGAGDYEIESTQQVHSPWAVSSSSRIQSFNNYAIALVPAAHADIVYGH